ncbi:hypothetical protein BDV59DRAFT_178611 [Aspergillus ambiguus]|uniref:uncharacterized protein n=1 Tax=Aspergillus ambiguus TaxID=176160 RepID=UPI003CCD7D13
MVWSSFQYLSHKGSRLSALCLHCSTLVATRVLRTLDSLVPWLDQEIRFRRLGSETQLVSSITASPKSGARLLYKIGALVGRAPTQIGGS